MKPIGPLLAHLRQSCYSMMCLHHPQLQRFDIGRPTSVVCTLSLKQAGTTEVNFSMPRWIGTTEMSLPGCSHLLYAGGRNSTSVMQIISFCEISSGELQITCTKNIVRNHTLVLHGSNDKTTENEKFQWRVSPSEESSETPILNFLLELCSTRVLVAVPSCLLVPLSSHIWLERT